MRTDLTPTPRLADTPAPRAAEMPAGIPATPVRFVTAALVAAILMALAFALTYWVAIRLYELRVFGQADVWFETDLNWYILDFSVGPRGLNYKHANLPFFVYFPVKNVAKVLAALGVSSLPTEQLHLQLALLVVPVVAAFRTLVFFTLFRRLLVSIWPAAALCAIDIFAFSHLTTGSIPESFPLSAACIAVMYWLVVNDLGTRPWLRAAAWLAIATVSIGITLTNAIPLVVLMCFAYSRGGVTLRSAATVAAIAATATVLNAGLALDVSRRYDIRIEPGKWALENREHYPATTGKTAEFAWAVAHTFIAPRPTVVPTVPEKTLNPVHFYYFSYASPHVRTWADLWRALVTVGLLAAGVLGLRRARVPLWLLAAPALIVVLNYVMHLGFGAWFFLYSQHWAGSLLIVLSGVAFLARDRRPALNLVLPAFAVLVAANSLYQLRWLFATLEVSAR